MSLAGKRIYVAGHTGMVGSAIVRELARLGRPCIQPDDGLDLRSGETANSWFGATQPDIVFLAAARVGGIKENIAHPASIIRDNLMIQTNVIRAAQMVGCVELIFLGSSCMYPPAAPQPFTEDQLMTGPLDETCAAYAMAKLAGMAMCKAYSQQYGVQYFTVIPCNLYGDEWPKDLEAGHVIPALAAKILEAKKSGAKEIQYTGTGTARREFMHVDDAAAGIVSLAESDRIVDSVHRGQASINLGSGEELSIAALVDLLAGLIGWKGRAIAEGGPDGPARKIMNSDKARALGWAPKIPLREGLQRMLRGKM